MFISEFSGDAKFSLASFTMLVYLMVNNINKTDHFTNSDVDRSNRFETIIYDTSSNFNILSNQIFVEFVSHLLSFVFVWKK